MSWIRGIGTALSIFGGVMQRSSQRSAQRAYSQAAADRANKVAEQTYRQQVKTIRQNYLNNVREREWNYWNAMSDFYISEQQEKFGMELQRSRSEFEFASTEINRRLQHDLEALSLESQEVQRQADYDQRVDEARRGFLGYEVSAARHNFDVEMQYMIGQQRKKLNELELGMGTDLQDANDRRLTSIALQRYNIAVGEVGVGVAKAQIAGNQAISAVQRDALEKAGARLALGQTGNTVARLLLDISNDKSEQEQEILGQMDEAVGQGEVQVALAKLKLAEALVRQKRIAPKVLAGAVMGVRVKSFLDEGSKWRWDEESGGLVDEAKVKEVEGPKEPPVRDVQPVDGDPPEPVDVRPLDFYKNAVLPGAFRPGPKAAPFRARAPLAFAPYMRGSEPVRGPDVPLPAYPEEPIKVTPEQISGGGGGGSTFFDALGGMIDVGRLIWGTRRTPQSQAGPPPATPGFTPYTGHPMTAPYGQRYLP